MKRILAILTAIVSAFVILSVSGCDDKGGKEYIGIISAMDKEIEVLIENADIEKVETVGGEKYHVGTLCGKNVIITKSGIGKVRASSGVTTMFNTYNISKLIFTGVAGGVADETEVLDEIVATRVLEHDYGIRTNDGFIWRSGDPGIGDTPGEYYYCDKDLVDIAYNAAVEVVGNDHAYMGTIATGDQFIASEEYVNYLKTEYDAYACEMEGAAVAAICIKYQIPFVVIRALSDKADGNAHESYDNFIDIAGGNSCRIVMKFLKSL